MMAVILTPLDVVVIFVDVLNPIVQHVFAFVNFFVRTFFGVKKYIPSVVIVVVTASLNIVLQRAFLYCLCLLVSHQS